MESKLNVVSRLQPGEELFFAVMLTSLVENCERLMDAYIVQDSWDERAQNVIYKAVENQDITLHFQQDLEVPQGEGFLELNTAMIVNQKIDAYIEQWELDESGRYHIDEQIWDAKADYLNRVPNYSELMEQAVFVFYQGNPPWGFGDYHYVGEKIWWNVAKKTPYYLELMELFKQNAMSDFGIEKFLSKMLGEQIVMLRETKESFEINEQLMQMLNQGGAGK